MLCKGVVDLDLESKVSDDARIAFDELLAETVVAAAPDST
jgi:hypothetical protein